MSARCNEYELIDRGLLNFNPWQRDEDCFVLEPYLVDQYQGDQRVSTKLGWKHDVFRSAFRWPYSHELYLLNRKNSSTFKSYKFKSSDFLHLWDKHYLKYDNSENRLTLKIEQPIEITTINISIALPAGAHDAVLSQDEAAFDQLAYFDQAPFIEKDNFGKFPYVIIGENSFDRPIVGSRIITPQDSAVLTKASWMAYQHILDFEDWPRQ